MIIGYLVTYFHHNTHMSSQMTMDYHTPKEIIRKEEQFNIALPSYFL